MDVVEKVLLFIPASLDHFDHLSKMKLEEVKIISVKTSDVKYFIHYPERIHTRINQIVAEDFTVYDLQLDFHSKTLSFYLESTGRPSQSEILQKVFQTFAVKYSQRKVGFFLYSKGRNRPNPVLVK